MTATASVKYKQCVRAETRDRTAALTGSGDDEQVDLIQRGLH